MFTLHLLGRQATVAKLRVACFASVLPIALGAAAFFAPTRADAQGESIVHTFTPDDQATFGDGTSGPFVQGTDGTLYGSIPYEEPGYGPGGSIYKVLRSGNIKLVHHFYQSSIPNDSYAPSAIVFGKDGDLYGTTLGGGTGEITDTTTFGEGVFFKLTPAGAYTVLHNFTGLDGGYATGGFVQGPDGAFYGVTLAGGTGYSNATHSRGAGVAYRITPDGHYTVIHDFGNSAATNGPTYLESPLLLGSDGMLYGVSQGGGTNQGGTVYKMTTSGVVTILHSFANSTSAGTDPNAPDGPLTEFSPGMLYGVTFLGGAYGVGTLYKVATDGSSFTSAYDFGYGIGGDSNPVSQEGEYPYGALTLGSDGNLYGATEEGGNFTIDQDGDSLGQVYQVTPSGEVNFVYDYATSSLDGTAGGLVQGTDGGLWATGIREEYDGSFTTGIYELTEGLPKAAGQIAALTLSAASVTGGNEHADATVTLAAAAEPGGVKIEVHSGNSALASVDPFEYVPAGHSVTSFRITTSQVSSPARVRIVATANGTKGAAALELTPAAPLASLVSNTQQIVGGSGFASMTLTLASPAPAGGEKVAVTTTDGNAAEAPLLVPVPAGETTANFRALTHTVSSDQTVTITALSGGVSKSVQLTVSAP